MKERAVKRQFPSPGTVCISSDGDGSFWHKTARLVGRIICDEHIESAAEKSGDAVGGDTVGGDTADVEGTGLDTGLDTDVVDKDVEVVEESGVDFRWFFH